MNKYAIILAAGKGTRMKSDLPKVLHPVCGTPMLQHIINKLKKIDIDKIIVVIGHKADKIRETIKDDVIFVEQTEQNGTAHAVLQAVPHLAGKEGTTLVITGDTPLIEEVTLESLLQEHTHSNSKGTVLTAIQNNPTGYGRIIREFSSVTDKHEGNKLGNVVGIVEEKDADVNQKKIIEVNTGIFAFDNQSLLEGLPKIENKNVQNEYYLTDIVSVFIEEGKEFGGHLLQDPNEAMGINSRVQLSEAETIMRKKINQKHMDNGVTIIDPSNTYIESEVIIGNDTTIYPGTVIKGNTIIGSGVTIYSNSEIQNATIGNHSIIRQSVIHDSIVGQDVQIGPFAHIRPKTEIKNKAKVGNFVELKGTTFGEGSKANHLSYIGDAVVGAGVNVGCGTITVNYDGKNKFKTIIEDGSFIGCNANLMAPVTIGKNSIIAAGSTVTKDVPEDALAISRTKQENKEGYATKIKNRR
ncbi:bifunctional UDP-N-acetylglucosamine diphosphorylase/glucosamine-1-phosphate N-acetyltransferase GlmU [Bacillus thuringiensis]|uniref:bifunctional UDP-N-acetylglucosamine diphosphorylase/glucosamine-1-phosphate N-acetyltransferase GlmU n=1 Tax=Bacillus thuringiensis TaxID=1428 RepID=UPI0021D69728|nr:bifunctional UDP-N-acetylglucosamine diphosphorylase/glucosamine-1-phosphate N-acetyltransferase GlmU [Bacillus thuringiensis]MCU7667145.1 bifunctional UDP-N-acetylglucosamine diphosphorylase/glucosamine-1-phosphate N-acetyltransferase GlmU [Bacillus thuringiensis]